MRCALRTLFLFVLFLGFAATAFAATGVIDPLGAGNYKAKLLNDPGLGSLVINFGKFSNQSSYNISVLDDELRGYAWGESTGWIVVNCLNTASGCHGGNGNFKVANDGDGLLSGYAWGENTGWINFGPFSDGSISRVKIASNGQFGGSTGSAGYAWSENFGWIVFDCSNGDSCVETDWDADGTTSGSGGSGGGGGPGGGGGTNPPPPPPPPGGGGGGPGDGGPGGNPGDPGGEGETPPPSDPGDEDPDGNSSGSKPQPWTPDPSFIERILPILPKTGGIVKRILEQATGVVSGALETIGAIIDTPVGRATIAVTTGTGILAMITQTLFSNGWRFFLSLLGFFRKRRNWGTVYDSVTKQPLDPAYVVAYDSAGKEVATQITDLDGRFGFLLPSGTYYVQAGKTHYAFPSKILAGKASDGIYNDLYFGEPIVITDKEQIIVKNIPMDPLEFDWNEAEKRRRKLFYFTQSNTFHRLADIAFLIGFSVSFLVLAAAPSLSHALIFSIYLIAYIFKTVFLPPPAGSFVLEEKTRKPLAFALVRVYGANSKSEMMKKITSATGRFYCLIANGNYFLTVEQRNDDGTYTLIHTSPVFSVKKGVIVRDVLI